VRHFGRSRKELWAGRGDTYAYTCVEHPNEMVEADREAVFAGLWPEGLLFWVGDGEVLGRQPRLGLVLAAVVRRGVDILTFA
jgi:hypothetical protein